MEKSPLFYKVKYRSMLLSGTITAGVDYLMLLCDNIITGRMIGPDGVAAIHIAVPLIVAVNFLSSCITDGTAILYTRAIGAMDRKRANQIYGMGMIVSVICAVLVSALLFLFREKYLHFCGASGVILTYAGEYFRLLPLCAALQIIRFYLEETVYSDGDENLEVLCYIVQFIGNIVLSILLTKVMGIRGIILGTIVGNGAAILILALHFLKKSNTLHFVPYFSWKDLGQCFKYSITDAIVFLLWGGMDLVMISFISRNFGESYLTVMAVIFSMIELSVIFDGIGMAIQPLIGVYFGEKNHLMIRRLMKDGIRTAVIEGITASVLIFIFAPQFAWLFGITDIHMLVPSVTAIRIVSLTFTASSLFMLETSYYLYVDHIRFSVGAIILKDGILSTLLPILFAHFIGTTGLWIGFALAPVLGLALSMQFLYLYAGKDRFPLLLEDSNSEIIVYDAILSPQSMTNTSRAVQAQLEKHNYPKKTAIKAGLFVEEISAVVREKNDDKEVLMEYSLLFDKDSVRLVIRDSGNIFDVTDPDLQITGLSSFVINGLLNAQKEKDYIPTTGYNRNLIRFDAAFPRYGADQGEQHQCN